MKPILAILFLVLATQATPAQTTPPPVSSQSDVDALLHSAEQWANENLDDNVLAALKEIDRDKVRSFLTELDTDLRGTNVYQLDSLRDTATQLLPVLQQFEETQPLSTWLQTRVDYLDTARELKRVATAPTTRTNNLTLHLGPPPQVQRVVWARTLEKRPIPAMAQPYLPQLKKAFRAEGTPPELAWLAEVESSFDARARSPHGAAGLFQLTPSAAREEGLSTGFFDERLQPEKSAHAAAKRLHDLHHHYGDWRLALAAYNAGEGRVDKLLEHSKSRSFDAIARRLPAETQMYVPKVEATIRRREGIGLEDLKSPSA